MSQPASIVIYGRDLSLLESRGWVLERAGYRILLALELERVEEMVGAEPIDLLLICHSLSPEDCEEVLAVTGPMRPAMKRLLMTANTVVPSSASREKAVSAFDGPVAMIAAVKKLVPQEDGAQA